MVTVAQRALAKHYDRVSLHQFPGLHQTPISRLKERIRAVHGNISTNLVVSRRCNKQIFPPASARKKSEIVSHTCYWKKRYLKISRDIYLFVLQINFEIIIYNDSAYEYMLKIIAFSYILSIFIISNIHIRIIIVIRKREISTKILDFASLLFK